MILRYIFKRCITKSLVTLVVVIQLASCSGGNGGNVSASSSGSGSIPIGFPTSISLSWDAPMFRSDGATRLETAEVRNYRIYFGIKSGEYLGYLDVAGGTNTQIDVPGLPPGTYYIVVTTIDTEGRESLYSPEVIKIAEV